MKRLKDLTVSTDDLKTLVNTIKQLPFGISVKTDCYQPCFMEKFTASEKRLPKQKLNEAEKILVIILDQISREIFLHPKNYSEKQIQEMLTDYRFIRKILFNHIIQRLQLNPKEVYVVSYREGFQIVLNSPTVINWGPEDNDWILTKSLPYSHSLVASTPTIN